MTRVPVTVGVDVGGTNVRAALVDADGSVLDERRGPSPEAWSELCAEIVTAVRGVSEGHGLDAVGVGAAGMVSVDSVIQYAPNVPGFRQTPVRQDLEAALGVPVVVDNDANAAAYGELRHGAGRGMSELLVITLGTGIGGGIVTGGRLLRGARGFAAEVGHFQIDPDGPMCACGERGHWEAFASGSALGALARDAVAAGAAPSVLAAAGGRVDAVRGEHVGAAARDGAPDALALLDTYADHVGIGLAALANILDPERIVVSGGLVELGELLLGPVRHHFRDRIEGADWRACPDIVEAELGTRAGVVGAAALARDHLLGS